MATILNIDTSSKYCSLALAIDGEIVLGLESPNEMDHSSSLAPFVEKAFKYLKEHKFKLDSIAVTIGPGSYTGLRIGLSLAKGICYSEGLPLITLSTLEVLAVRALFSIPDLMGTETIIAMMDAGRMEVYTGIYDCALNLYGEEHPEILNENSFSSFSTIDKVLFIGDGSEKFKDLYKGENAIWLGNKFPHARFMTSLAEKRFRERIFSDVAYSTPLYLKEYQAIKSKNRLLNI